MRATAVYRIWSRDGELLYVGTSLSVASRLMTHDATKQWWQEVGSITLVHYPDYRDAVDAERLAINSEGPRFNQTGPGQRDRATAARTGHATRRARNSRRPNDNHY